MTLTLDAPTAPPTERRLHDRTAAELRRLVDSGRYRTFLASDNDPAQPGFARLDDRRIAVWCSNDYLGLSQHPEIIGTAVDELRAGGLGAGGSRNISGTAPAHVALERELAAWHGMPAALLFSSGYVANVETIGALRTALPELLVLSDRLNHRSLIEGIRSRPGETQVFEHNDTAHLRELLAAQPAGRPMLIVAESIYSMDADLGPVRELCDLAEEFGAMTYLDETHAVGTRGPQGAGLLAELGETRATFVQAVCGKALGTLGGYVAGPGTVIDYVRSTAPGFIFTTALPPAVVAATSRALALARGAEGDELRERVARTVDRLKTGLTRRGIPFLDHDSHFVPVLVPGADRVRAVASTLLSAHDVYVQPINAPSVQAGTERFRLAPGPARSAAEIDAFVDALDDALHRHPSPHPHLLSEGLHP